MKCSIQPRLPVMQKRNLAPGNHADSGVFAPAVEPLLPHAGLAWIIHEW